MRVAYLCCDFGVRVLGTSGASVHVREITTALERLGHTVQVFAATDEGNGAAVADDGRGMQFVPLEGFAAEVIRLLKAEDNGQPAHLVREWRRLLYAEYAQRALLPRLIAFRPDVIYERYSLFSYAGIELARRLGTPLLLEVNAPLSVEAAKYRELILKRTAQELERSILGGADALLVVSTALEDYARRLGVPAERITVLPNGVNPDRFHPGTSGEAARAQYGLRGRHVVGFVGSLKRWHDLDTVLGAARLLAEGDGRTQLLVVGEGPRAEELQAIGSAHVTCTGAVAYDRVPELMAAMDVVVVPYALGADTYFSPLKLFEAMAMAKPIVGARVGQVAEILTHDENGLLYDPGDAGALARAIRDLLDHPERGARLGAAARRAVVSERTWEANACRIADVAEACRARGVAAAVS
jgi:glycosyltransferase involved in cell wall biosynthesis